MIRTPLVFVLLLVSDVVFSQATSAIPQTVRAAITLERLSFLTPSDLIYGIPLPEKEVRGDSYLDVKWRSSTLLMYESEKLLEGYPVRYNVLKDEMEIKTKSGTKVLAGKKIKSFVWIDSLFHTPQYFVNSREYKNERDMPMTGFCQVLADGKIPLLKHTEVVLRKANYSVQLDIGSRDDVILKKPGLLYATEGARTYPVPSTKKKLVQLLGDKQKEVERFISINSLSMKEEHHLIKIFEYYNSLN